MTTNTDRGALEALLFVSDEPASASALAHILDRTEAEVADMLTELAGEYAAGERGFQLREVAGGWRLYTHPAYHELVEGYVLSWDTRRLSQAALEALSVIAYHQPVTRVGINAVRGVNSEAVISSLIEKGLVRELGRDKAQGNAILYATTRSFLEKFGLKDLSGLPPLEDFAPDEEAQESIRLRLGAGASVADALTPDEDDDLLYGTGNDKEAGSLSVGRDDLGAPPLGTAMAPDLYDDPSAATLELGSAPKLPDDDDSSPLDALDRNDDLDLVDDLEDVEELD